MTLPGIQELSEASPVPTGKCTRLEVTINNPTEADKDLLQEIKEKKKDVAWIKGANELRLIWAVEEEGEQGTPHIHLCINHKNAVTFRSVQKWLKDNLDRNWWMQEQTDKSPKMQDAFKYLSKLPANADPSNWLCYWSAVSRQGARTDLDILRAKCIEADGDQDELNKTMLDLNDVDGSVLLRYMKQMDRMNSTILKVKAGAKRRWRIDGGDAAKMLTIYIYGNAGVGKSQMVWSLIGTRPYASVQLDSSQQWWNDTHAQIAVIDDVNESNNLQSNFLRITDPHYANGEALPTKGSFGWHNFDVIFITSNVMWNFAFPKCDSGAMTRRLKVYEIADSGWTTEQSNEIRQLVEAKLRDGAAATSDWNQGGVPPSQPVGSEQEQPEPSDCPQDSPQV